MFPFSMFTMSKAKTVAWTVFCIGMFLLFASLNMAVVGFVFLPWGLILGCIAAYKFIRDHGIITSARQIEAEQRPVALPPPPMTSEGSGRLFVPPPLDRR